MLHHELLGASFPADFGETTQELLEDSYIKLKFTPFSDCIFSSVADPGCPVGSFTEGDVDKFFIHKHGRMGYEPAKVIGLLKDGRYFYLVSDHNGQDYCYNYCVVGRELAGLILFSLSDEIRRDIGWEALGI